MSTNIYYILYLLQNKKSKYSSAMNGLRLCTMQLQILFVKTYILVKAKRLVIIICTYLFALYVAHNVHYTLYIPMYSIYYFAVWGALP